MLLCVFLVFYLVQQFSVILPPPKFSKNNSQIIHLTQNSIKSYQTQIKKNKICETPYLLNSPIYKDIIRNLKSFKNELKTNFRYYKIDEIDTFYVRNLFDQSKWYTIQAQMIFDTTKISIWIDTSAINSIIDSTELQTIKNQIIKYLLNQTDEFSIACSLGIMDILHDYFGDAPNVDGDGKLDILLLDIRDQFNSTGSYVAGFFDPNDLTTYPYSNKRDLIYIDIYPTIKFNNIFNINNAISTISHEYQHLIHANYETEEPEFIFINEGISELAEIVCGFPPREAEGYFSYPNRSLLTWNYENPIPDYSRASLWTHYLFEQVGYERIKYFVQSPLIGTEGIRDLLNHSNLPDFEIVFNNWGRANLINDISLNTSYGYVHPLRQNIKFTPTAIYDTLPYFDAISLSSSSQQVIEFSLTQKLKFQIENNSDFLNFSTLIKYPDGSINFQETIQLENETIFAKEKEYASIIFLLQNSKVFNEQVNSEYCELKFLASGEKSGQLEICKYDDGSADKFYENASYLLIKSGEKVGVVFSPKEKVWLSGVSFKNIFLSEIQGNGISEWETRDLVVQVSKCINGKPAEQIGNAHLMKSYRNSGTLKFETYNLLDDYSSLSALQDSFCIILSNDEDDSNYFAIGMDSTNISATYIYNKLETETDYYWHEISDINIEGVSLAGWNCMIRANIINEDEYATNAELIVQFSYDIQNVYLTIFPPFIPEISQCRCVTKLPSGEIILVKPTANQPLKYKVPLELNNEYEFYLNLNSQTDNTAIDTVLTYKVPLNNDFFLANNYPNPFNASTKFPVLLLKDGLLSIKIYDLLGRKVKDIDQLFYERGKYEIELNFRNNASGIYFAQVFFEIIETKEVLKKQTKLIMIK